MDITINNPVEDQGSSLWQDAWLKLRKKHLALFGLFVIVVLCIIALLTPWIAPYGYEEQNLLLGATPPSIAHWLGTDIFGRNILLLFLAIGAVEWLTMARIVRSQVMSLRKQEFIEAAYSLRLSRWTIIRKHIIPNSLGPVIVYTTLTIPSVMLLEAFLSFLGLGIQPPQCSWGLLINYGVETMEEYPWLLIFPGVALSLTLFALNFLGDGLRDALDPRTSKD